MYGNLVGEETLLLLKTMADVEEPVEPQPEEAEVADEGPEEEEILAPTTEVKLFGKWSFDDIEISDLSLEVSVSCADWLARWNLCCGLLLIRQCLLPLGLHCLQGRPCHLLAPHGRPIPKKAFPQGFLPHCGTSCLLSDAQGTQQR